MASAPTAGLRLHAPAKAASLATRQTEATTESGRERGSPHVSAPATVRWWRCLSSGTANRRWRPWCADGWENLATPPLLDDPSILEAIIAGRCDLGIANSYYLARFQRPGGGPGLALFWPDQRDAGVHVNIIGAGVAHHAPMRYLCAVESAMRERLGADRAYGGLITKNPAHGHWRTLWGPEHRYTLDELAEYLPGLEKHIPRKRPELVGLGRNVDTFDWLRHHAYREIRLWRDSRDRPGRLCSLADVPV